MTFRFTRELWPTKEHLGGYNDSGATQHSSALHHVLYLIGILEGPATFDSSLEVSQKRVNHDRKRDYGKFNSHLHSLSQDFIRYYRRREHLAIVRKSR